LITLLKRNQRQSAGSVVKMKTRFTTLDIISILEELQQYVGMRVNQVYDVDNKTYLIKLHQPDKKVVLLIESGTRLHTTEFEWPKNPAPSGFSMKLRKHINNKRLVHIKQLGIDRVVDLQFGDGEAAHHLILEMYDRGNLVLTDFELKILNILRPRVAGEERFLVRETYPVELAKQEFSTLDEAVLREAFGKAKETDTLKKVLMPHFDLGPALLEHLLLQESLHPSSKLKEVDLDTILPSLLTALQNLPFFLKNREKQGYVIQKAETRPRAEGGEEEFLTIQEFHPFLYSQHASSPFTQHETFNGACDIFFSQVEAQRIELKSVQQERNAVKKLENVKKDHETRIKSLQELQDLDRLKGELIEMNNEIVDNAIKVILSAIANQIPWDQIKEIIKEATENRDPVASRIKQIKLETNHIVMQLEDPYAHLDYDDDDSDEDDSNDKKKDKAKEHLVDIDLGLTAQANARKYFVQKKSAAVKERKTLESGGVALKSAEKKTKAALKEMAKISTIIKARKVYWFEKFFWFISSENFLVIGGRDAQQNELLVKRYMKPTDIYVHADLHGAATVIVKNPSSDPVPPKTLNEAGQFAVCFSAAWDSKVLTAAYWVTPDQVSKTAPSGEYLTVGSFMIRGKKNFLPPSQLTMGFAFLFCLTEDSLERHKDERKVRGLEESKQDVKEDESVEELTEKVEDVEIDVEGGDSSDEETEAREPLEEIKEEVEDKDGSQDHIREDVTEEPGLNADEGDNSDASEEREEEEPAPQTNTDESSSNVIEFPDTDVKIGYDRLGSVEIKTRTVSTSEDHNEDKKKASSNNKDKTKFQGGFKPQKGQKKPGTSKRKGRWKSSTSLEN